MAKQMTIRGVPDEVARRLQRMSRTKSRSVNATVLGILSEAVGIEARRERLARYATWTAQDVAEIERALAGQRVVDDDLWR